MINVLFVCLGNICRSPMAEAIFKDLVQREGLSDQFHIDSVGTAGYHVGSAAHPGTHQVLAAHNIPCDSIARQLNGRDLAEADYLIAMDESNAHDIQRQGRTNGQLHLLLDFAKNSPTREVPDPYYTGNFERVYQLVSDGCTGLLAHIRAEQLRDNLNSGTTP